MNPFDRIREYRAALLLQIKDTLVRPSDTLTYEEHYKTLLTFLKLLEGDLQTAEYNYVIERIDNDPSSKIGYSSYDKMTLQASAIGDNLLLFQPIFTENDTIYPPDMDSLIEALGALKKNGRIKEDMLIVPPGVNVLRARLADPNNPDDAVNAFGDSDEDMDMLGNPRPLDLGPVQEALTTDEYDERLDNIQTSASRPHDIYYDDDSDMLPF